MTGNNASGKSEKGSASPARKTHSSERALRTAAVVEKAHTLISGESGAIVYEAGVRVRCQRTNSASDCTRGPTVKALYSEGGTNAV